MSEKKKLLGDVLRAEAAGLDLQDGQYGMHVYAMRENGTLYELGSVCTALVLNEPEVTRAIIERIKFGGRANDCGRPRCRRK
jgi:hypothetical protein